VLRRIFGPKREQVVGGWRKLHNEGLHNLCTSQNIIRVITSWMMGWAGHVTRMGEVNAYKFSSEDLKGRVQSEDLVVDRRMIINGS